MTEPTSRMEMRADGPFRILQVTDFHDHEGEEAAERTWRDVRWYVERHEPDLLAVTGDIWCGDDLPEEEAQALMRRDVGRIEGLGVPWAFCWGNHDYFGDLGESMALLSSARGSAIPHGAAQGNYRIEVARGTEPAWDLFFLNSGTAGLGPEAMEWYAEVSRRLREERGRVTPAVAFFHVPLRQYETAWHEGKCQGIRNEDVLYYDEDGRSLARFQEAGNVRACFVGHSHVNDYWCECEGIVLAYGRATGHGGYGGEQVRRGAKLIELSPEGELGFRTVLSPGWE